MASAEKMQIGDFADVEAGGVVYVVHTAGYAVASRPFLKVTTHPSENWTVGYRMATSRELQSYAGLNTVQQELPVGTMSQGRMRTEGGLHQEFAIGRKFGPGLVQLAYYLDSLDQVMVNGGGPLQRSRHRRSRPGERWPHRRSGHRQLPRPQRRLQDSGHERHPVRAHHLEYVGRPRIQHRRSPYRKRRRHPGHPAATWPASSFRSPPRPRPSR